MSWISGIGMGATAVALVSAPFWIHALDDEQTITPVESCAMSMSDAQAEDDLCVSWVDDDGDVVVGPAWLK